MFRGYFGGAFWGLVTSGVGLGTLSLVAQQPAGNEPPSQPVIESPEQAEAVDGTSVDEVVPDVTADAGGAPAPSDTPEVGQAEDETDASGTDTASTEQPESGEVTTQLAAPEVAADPEVAASADDPVETGLQALIPEIPTGDTEPDVDTQSAAEPAPEVEEDVAVAEPVEGAAPDVADLVEDVVAAVDPAAEEVQAEVAEADALSAADTEEVIAAIEPEDAATEAPVLVAPEVDGTLPVTPSTDEAADGESPLIVLRGDEATLPGEGSVQIIEEAAEAEEAAAVEVDAVSEAPTSALQAYAAAFETDGSKPLMSVILIDDGSLSGSEAALAEMPVPVTVAIDPASAGAADRMAVYRAAGFEILALAEVPAGALPTDAAVTLEAGFATVSESIGLLDIGQAGLQSSRDVAAQAMAQLSDSGRGFVTFSQGLNSGLRAADEADVAAVTVYRDIDADDQDARVIRRFLDQAAFRARQQGTVVLVGRVRADTITALTLWGTSNQDGPVEMAPVSALLMASQ